MITIVKKSTVATYKKTISNMERELDNQHILFNDYRVKNRELSTEVQRLVGIIDKGEVRILTRISQDVYDALAAKMIRPSCPKTDIEAAYSLGVQAVLEQIRLGWVV